MKTILIVLLASFSLFAFADDCTNGCFSCSVESIRCTSLSKLDAPSDDEEQVSTNLCESTLYLEVQCVISNKTPYNVDLTRGCIDDLFRFEHLFANGAKGEAVRLMTFVVGGTDNPKKRKYYTLKSQGRCRVRTRIGANDCSGLHRRLPDVRWQMLDQECIMMRGWIRADDTAMSHSEDDATRFEVELTFPKVLPLDQMGAFLRRWRDPKTGITWSYTVFRNEVSLGGGNGWEPATADNISGALEIPAVIEGMPVVGIGTQAFSHSDVESVHVPPSVRSIGYEAFGNCWSLKELSISSNATDIAESAFRYCDDLVIRRY